jgi:AcrR family transcriptional regulator
MFACDRPARVLPKSQAQGSRLSVIRKVVRRPSLLVVLPTFFGNITNNGKITRSDAPLMAAHRRKTRPTAGAPESLPALRVRARLLRAADEILATEGIQALTQTRVAEAAGVRQSHLTYYFATRSALVKAIVECTASGVIAEFTGNPKGRQLTLPEIRQRLVEQLSDRRMARRIVGMLVSTDEDPSLLGAFDEFEAQHLALMAQNLGQLGLDVSEMDVMLLHTSLIGISMRNGIRTSDSALREARTLIGEAFDRLVARATTESRRPRMLRRVRS